MAKVAVGARIAATTSKVAASRGRSSWWSLLLSLLMSSGSGRGVRRSSGRSCHRKHMLGQACRLEFGELGDHGRGVREASYDLHGFIPLLCPHDGQMYFQGLEHWVKTLDKDVHQLVFVHRLFVEGQLSLAKREVRDESLQVGVAIFLHGGAVEFQAEWADFIHGVDHESGSDMIRFVLFQRERLS